MNELKRFKITEKILTIALIVATIFFIIYLIAAGSGTIWLKVLMTIFIILICGLCLAYLYMTKLLTRPRTMWMTTAAGAILICLLFSLLLNFPSKL